MHLQNMKQCSWGKTYGSLCQFNLPNGCPSFSAPHKALKSSSPATTSRGEITREFRPPLCCGSPPLWDHSEALRLELRFVQSHRWSPPSMQLPCWGQPRVAQQGYWVEDLRFFVVFLLIHWKENPHKYLDISSSKENGVGLFDRTRFMRASN